MSQLTDDQLRFLRSQKIPLSSVFDASGMKKADYQVVMKEEGKSFAYGVTACRAGGHTLRTRSGHCIQCDHAKIAFMLRPDAQANVYIAASAAGRLIKIGSTVDIADRTDKLNRYQYGSQKDWQILATAKSPFENVLRLRFCCDSHFACGQQRAAGGWPELPGRPSVTQRT